MHDRVPDLVEVVIKPWTKSVYDFSYFVRKLLAHDFKPIERPLLSWKQGENEGTNREKHISTSFAEFQCSKTHDRDTEKNEERGT